MTVPSVQAQLLHCLVTWKHACAVLLRASFRSQIQAHHHQTPVPKYAAGQKVWLSARNHPFKVESQKFAPQ